MRALFTFLLITSLFCSGFTWGKSHDDRCVEANKLVYNQQRNNSEVIPNGFEKKIAELCPDGAAHMFILGLKSELGKQPDQAMMRYDSAIKSDEHVPDAYGRKGLLELSRKNNAAAMVALTRALEEGGNFPRYHLALAEILLETAAYPLVLYHYEKASSLGIPYTVDSLTGMARAYSGLRDWKDAETVTRQALYLAPDDPRVKSNLAQIVIRQQRLPEGIQLLKQAIAITPDDKSLHRELADALTASGDVAAATSEYALAGILVANETETDVRQGDTCFLQHDYPAAVRSYKSAAEKRPTPEIFQKLGDAYLAVGNDDEALKSYRNSLAISPDDPGVHYSTGIILERKGEIDNAISEYERCISLDKNNGDAHRRLAEIYLLKGDLQKVITEYTLIIEKAPDNPAMHFRLAKIYQRVGKLNDAKKNLEMAVLLDPKNMEPRRELIKVDIKRKDLASAEKICRGILAIDRDDQLERKRMVGILGQQKKYKELVGFLEDEISRYPNDGTHYYRLGIVKEHLKDFRGAIHAFQKSIEITASVQSYQALARAYLSIFEGEKAKEALAQASKLDPKKKEVKELIELIEEEFDHSNTSGSKKSTGKKKKRNQGASH
ncbi:MAG: tetratricopeptide repeat protein [Desulfuromonadaceae bacterium]|nr:tetratricopeptide repeat protein [Desulfuromonadaceae bacterium]